jgi:hypothetical protein
MLFQLIAGLLEGPAALALRVFWGSLPAGRYAAVMSTVVAAHSDSPSVREWNLQGEFLRHGDETYRDDLYAARALLRDEMDGESWSLQ